MVSGRVKPPPSSFSKVRDYAHASRLTRLPDGRIPPCRLPRRVGLSIFSASSVYAERRMAGESLEHEWERTGKSSYACTKCRMAIEVQGGADESVPHKDQYCTVVEYRRDRMDYGILVAHLMSCEAYVRFKPSSE